MFFQFAEFEIDLDKFELRRNGTPGHIEPRVFDLLVLLAKNPGRIITRDELIEELWKGRIVSDATISTTIKSARKALDDSGEEQKYIKTIRGRGITFNADVQFRGSENSIAGTVSTGAIKSPMKMLMLIAGALALIVIILLVNSFSQSPSTDQSKLIANTKSNGAYKVAVMPFIDMSENGDQEYFATGMAEEILNLLAMTPGLNMTSRTTAFSLKDLNLSVPEISQRLGVNYIVEGSIRTTGERVRVSAQLVDVAADTQLWSSNYDRKMTSIFEVQDDISEQIAGALKLELGSRARNREAPTNNMAAYDFYLRGHQLFSSRGTFGDNDRVGYLEEAISNLEQATLLDPNFAEAWAELAGVSMVIPTFDSVKYSFEEMAVRSSLYIDRALSLNENLSQAWATKGFNHLVSLEFAEAEQALRRATELRNNNETAWLWLGLTYTTLGGADKAASAIEHAIELDSSVTVNYNVIGAASHGGGDVALAAHYQKLAVFDRGFELGRIDTLLIALDPNYDDIRGRRAAALEDAKRYIDFLEKNTDPERDRKLALYVDAYLDPSLRDVALEALDNDIENRQKSAFIGAYMLGAGTRMARHLELGTENNGLNLRRIYSPVGRPLFQHKAFRDYLIKIGMLDYWKNNQFPYNCSAVDINDFECH